MQREPIRLGTRARITRAVGIDTEHMLELARATAPDPSVFDEYAPLFWRVMASSNRLDFYHTRMRGGTGKTLDNFVQGLKRGVSYQDSHDPTKNGWGQSLDGRLLVTDEYDPEIGEHITEVWGDFFTLSGINLSGQSTSDFGAAIRAGVWRDVSVGFFATDIECGLCGRQVYEFWSDDGCPHLPGLEYELHTDSGSTVRKVAWAWINDGELSEVSQVYDGASPSAAVVKAEQMSLEGMLPESERARIERRYQVRIAQPNRIYALGGMPLDKEDEDMQRQQRTQDELTDQQLTNAPQDDDDETRASEQDDQQHEELHEITEETVIEFSDERATTDDELDGMAQIEAEMLTGEEGQLDVLHEERQRWAEHGIRIGTSPVKAVRALAQEVVRLRPLADMGVRYREELIENTISEGVRAYGASFPSEQYRGILSKLDIDGIRTMRDTFAGKADQLFAGGRVTREEAEPEGTPESERAATVTTKRGKRGSTKIDPTRFKA